MRRVLLWSAAILAISLATTALAQPLGPPGPDRDRDGRPPRPEAPPPPPNPLLEALDTDHDGALSTQEIAAAGEALKKLDKDGDGKLSREELRPPMPPRPPRGDGPPRGRGRRGPGDDDGPRRGPPPGDDDGPRRGPRFDDDGPRRGPPPGDDDGPRRRPPRGPGDDDGPRRGPPPPDGGPRAGLLPPLLPPHVVDELDLSGDQRKQFDDLQKEVRAKIEKILTSQQRDRLAELHRHGPGGPDGPPPRRPPRGGPPDDEDDDDRD